MEDNGVVNINGRTYDWGMIRVGIGGVPTMNCTAIDYSDDQEVVAVYAGGRLPVGYGKGRITCAATITLLMEDVAALQSSAPNGRLQDIAPFSVTVSYLHPDTNKVHTDILKGCVMTGNSRSWSEGDAGKTVQIPLLVSAIKWGKTV